MDLLKPPALIGIHSLPPELLVSLFKLLCYNGAARPPSTQNQHPSRHPPPALMLVCRAWYEIIRNNPTFWSVIVLRGDNPLSKIPVNTDTPGADGRVEWLRECLKRSGDLSINLIITSERLLGLRPLLQTIHEHAYRFQTFTVVLWNGYKDQDPEVHIPPIKKLLDYSFPALKNLLLSPPSFQPFVPRLMINTESPELHTLSCFYHMIIPSQPSNLTRLTLKWFELDDIQPPLGGSQIELPNLLELCLKKCRNPLGILSALSAPALQKLTVHQTKSYIRFPPEIPPYRNLRELQWEDVLPDLALGPVLRSCPNLTRFANYIVDRRQDLQIRIREGPPCILNTVIKESPGINERKDGKWPPFDELLLDSATCEELKELVKIIPTIKRIYLLKDPTKRRGLKDKKREKELLASMRHRVDVVIRHGSS
ncbi:hypothetical protein M407DRAFT_29383 [Tulasnella calospora MUT 4182]|uniref:Uncharacterized protein n=1 Tax=Tulasnella calospora MUT 4182 TaxID=1051891 RepID=A0A0C3Q917_9AGAM|nr:hypothetical protein M407DRAFT_29383 [Tulasnella calospora MUT 4182]